MTGSTRERWRGIAGVGILLFVLAAGWAIWRSPGVQEGLLSRADVTTLADRVAADPADWRAQYWYGRRLAEIGELAQAETALRTSLGSHPDDVPGLTELGKVMLAQKRTEEAFQLLRMATGRDPRNRTAHLALALLYRSQGTYQRAMDEASLVLQQDPNDVQALYELGASQALAQQSVRAEETFRRALRKAPNDLPCLLGLGRVLQRQGKLTEAEAEGRKALKLAPNDPDALVLLARILAHKTPLAPNQAEALRLLAHARDIASARIDIRLMAAEILAEQGRWKDAYPELLLVTRANPSNSQAFFLLSRAYRNLGQLEAARKAEAEFRAKDAYDRKVAAFNDEISADPESAALRFKLGALHEAAGHPDLAIAAYKSGLQRDPANDRVRKRLSQLLQEALQK